MAGAYGFSVNTEGVDFTTTDNKVYPLSKGDFVILKGSDDNNNVGLVVFNALSPADVKVITVRWDMDLEYKTRAWSQSQAITVFEAQDNFDAAVSQAQAEANAEAATQKAMEVAKKLEEETRDEESKKRRSKVICIATGLGLLALALWVMDSKKK